MGLSPHGSMPLIMLAVFPLGDPMWPFYFSLVTPGQSLCSELLFLEKWDIFTILWLVVVWLGFSGQYTPPHPPQMHAHTCARVHIQKPSEKHIYTRIHMYMCIYPHNYTCAHTKLCMHTQRNIMKHTCMCVDTHSHKNTQAHPLTIPPLT